MSKKDLINVRKKKKVLFIIVLVSFLESNIKVNLKKLILNFLILENLKYPVLKKLKHLTFLLIS